MTVNKDMEDFLLGQLGAGAYNGYSALGDQVRRQSQPAPPKPPTGPRDPGTVRVPPSGPMRLTAQDKQFIRYNAGKRQWKLGPLAPLMALVQLAFLAVPLLVVPIGGTMMFVSQGELGVAGVYGALWGGFGIIAFFRGRREARIARPYDTRHPIVKRGINMMLLITGAMCSVSAFLAFSSAG